MIAIGICCAGVLTAIILGGLIVWSHYRARPIEVKPGDDVVTSGGLAGRVVKIEGDWLRLRLTRERGGVHATVLRSAVVGRWEGEKK